MRDPLFPAVLTLIFLVTVWLGIVGPMPDGFAVWLKAWQPLVAASVALCAAYVAFRNTNRSIEHASGLERTRRSRKHAAVRAVLPVALSHISEYAERSAVAIDKLVQGCLGGALPAGSAPEDLIRPLEASTLETLTDFIEYSESIDVGLIEATLSKIQVHDSRLRDVIAVNRNPLSDHITTRNELEGYIVDAAVIYAGAAAAYSYARRETSALPSRLSWDEVRSALRNMRFWDEEYPRLEEDIGRRAKVMAHPHESGSLLDKLAKNI